MSKIRGFSVTIGFFWCSVSVAVGEPSWSRCLPVGEPSRVSMLHKLLDISCKGVLNFITWGWLRRVRDERGWEPRLPVGALCHLPCGEFGWKPRLRVAILETAPTGGDSGRRVSAIGAVGNRVYRW